MLPGSAATAGSGVAADRTTPGASADLAPSVELDGVPVWIANVPCGKQATRAWARALRERLTGALATLPPPERLALCVTALAALIAAVAHLDRFDDSDGDVSALTHTLLAHAYLAAADDPCGRARLERAVAHLGATDDWNLLTRAAQPT
jgi:hypothetical protein